MIVTSIDTLTSLIGGFTIFAILGNLAYNLGIENIGDVVKSGTGLAFISYPDAISKFDLLPQVKINHIALVRSSSSKYNVPSTALTHPVHLVRSFL